MVRKRRSLAQEAQIELREMIAQEYPPGSRLPSEAELADRLEISRNTLREAMLTLWDEGLVDRRWGVGTFVRQESAPVSQNFSTFLSAQDRLRQPGLSLLTSDLSLEPGTAEACGALGVELGTSLWRLRKLFGVHETPTYQIINWVPTAFAGAPVDLTPATAFGVGVVDVLRESVGLRVTRFEATLSAVLADDQQAAIFAIPSGSPLIVAGQIGLDDDGANALYSDNTYNTRVSGLHMVRTVREESR